MSTAASLILILALGSVPAIAGKYATATGGPPDVQPTDDAALVIVLRPAMIGKAIKFWAFADDTVIGVTTGKQCCYAMLPPGSYVFWSRAENVSAFALEVEAGKTYYLKQKARMGAFKAQVRFEPVTEAEAKEGLAKCKLATLTEEGKQRAVEIAAESLAKAQEKAEKRAAKGGEEEEEDEE